MESDPNWKFWINFVFLDMLAYISLFLSVGSGIWNRRHYAIEVLTMPQDVIDG